MLCSVVFCAACYLDAEVFKRSYILLINVHNFYYLYMHDFGTYEQTCVVHVFVRA